MNHRILNAAQNLPQKVTQALMQATKELCFLCFEALVNKVTGSTQTKVSSVVIDPSNTAQSGLFVTWMKNSKLRGCIGDFDLLPLYSGLQEYAVLSGTKDDRFSPITESELPQLKCEISLLHSFEKAATVFDWEIGVHGISLFIDKFTATFLPEIAVEYNWTKEVTLSYLAKKSGFKGAFDDAAIARSRLERYQSSACTATWEEYQQYINSS
jgi:uncharacterized protein (TIGR00296 family)